ncbi:hypothetical protein CNECB9_5360042 [Cupriavidus necator]|uniref:Uncharacterized protein n=1 Tax=Cupriavidus necator TaxID=106590 RepID=A0A1K0JXC5_CUPNE|nr:hypothetical protein CNECB9_5360042 [Cupriavidus necator]
MYLPASGSAREHGGAALFSMKRAFRNPLTIRPERVRTGMRAGTPPRFTLAATNHCPGGGEQTLARYTAAYRRLTGTYTRVRKFIHPLEI